MPGELGNEEEQQGMGYREHLYKQDGEWMDEVPDKKRMWEETQPNSPLVMRVIKLHQKEQK